MTVHLENHQRVYFNNRNHNLQQALENPRESTLIAFFEIFSSTEFAKTLSYSEVLSYSTSNDSTRKLFRRKQEEDVPGYPGVKKSSAISRVYTVYLNQSECFYSRMLLHHIQGPSSWKDFKNVNDIVYQTFKATCLALGLLENDDQ